MMHSIAASGTSFNPHPAFWPDATLEAWRPPCLLPPCFNPHPAFWPDATSMMHSIAASGTSFNPHPAFWPDATRSASVLIMVSWAKFQSSPGLLAGCNDGYVRQRMVMVVFQSSPGLLAGCNPFGVDMPRRFHQFQSSPGLLAGCNPAGRPGARPRSGVSILTRPSGRMQLGVRRGIGRHGGRFNPHPAFWPDATALQ